MIVRVLFALILGLALTGCAAGPTPYRPKIDGTGYSQQQLDSHTWRVQFAGNQDTPRETVEDYLLYRSAEVILFGGFDKFVLLDKEVERNLEYRGYGYRPDLDYGRYRRGPWYYGQRYYGPADYRPLVSYSAIATIRVYTGGRPPNDGPVYDAREIIQQLGPTIVLPQQSRSG
jgi:hypothetical protein